MELNELEQRLVGCLRAGEKLDLVPHFRESDSIAAEIVSGWGTRHEIRASVIREILCGNLVDPSAVDPRGMMIRGARIRGRLDLADLECDYPLELTACFLPLGLCADYASFLRLSLKQCVVGTSRPVPNEFDAEGMVRLVGTKVNGQLNLRDAVLESTIGPALLADRLVVEGSMFLNGSFRAGSQSPKGAVSLVGAKIGGQLNLADAVLENTIGPALLADGLVVEGDVFLERSSCKVGEDRDGAVRLVGAKVGGQLSLEDAVLESTIGPALFADGLMVEGDMLLDGSFRASSQSPNGAVRLVGAKVGRRLYLRGAVLENAVGPASVENTVGPALFAERLTVEGDMFLNGSFHASSESSESSEATVCLRNAKVGHLHISDEEVLNPPQPCKWDVEGLTYGGVPTENPKIWLKVLQKHTVGYAAQPYQQLARAVRDAGHDGVARKILIAQRSDQLCRGQPGWKDWCWGAFTWATVGYGYRPWLSLGWLVFILLLVCWAVEGIYPEGLATVSELQKAGADPQCSSLEKFQVAVDMVIPLVSTGVEETCQFVARETAGEALARVSIIVQGASWALFTLFVAGFTGIVRRN